jgi:predicted transcriptional regulator YheO
MILELIINLLASTLFLFFGFLFGKYRERKLMDGSNLEEHDFYPFDIDEKKILYFNMEKFTEGVRYLLGHRDYIAAGQLILIGEQNSVNEKLKGNDGKNYKKLYRKYDGKKVINDSIKYLENYKRIVRLIGDSFPDTGIEILLHNLTNPSKALYHIKNNVTGRNIEAPASNLVHDLKLRGLKEQDKLNYELNIGSRKFKCTTIPIYRESYGLVGAICINVDYNYINEELRDDIDSLNEFLNSICKTDMVLEENILSKDEYGKALEGKKHFRDFKFTK